MRSIVDIELQDLKWAIVVSKFGSLIKVAERLCIQQSTLRRRLRFEYPLGVDLLHNGQVFLQPQWG